MPIPIIRTKLHRPPVARNHLHRQRLLDRLDERRHRPLTLVSAPAGYGKSTLVSCWLESCGCPNAWVSLSASDSDLRSFLAYFLEAIDALFPGSVKDTRRMLKAPELPSLDILSASLINEMCTIHKNFILVLDDYHTMGDKGVHSLIGNLLTHPPDAMHLVVATRRDPPFPLLELRARGQMTEIRVPDLQFSPSEVATFLRKMMGMEVDDHVAAVIGEKTEGWVAGLRLAVLSVRQRSDLPRIVAGLPDDNRYVMDYIITEVISLQPKDTQTYLLSTSILDRFCAPLCEAMCLPLYGSDACQLSGRQFITELEKENLFLIPLDDNRQWYRYHHLFRQLLQGQMKQSFSPEMIEDLNDQAGNWFDEKDLPDEALHYFMEAGNIPAARQLIVRHRYDLTLHEQWHRLNRWIDAIPKKHIDADPEILIITAWLHENRERYQEMRSVIERIDQLLIDDSISPMNIDSILGELDAMKAAEFYLGGNVRQAGKHAARAIENIQTNHLSERAFAILIYAITNQMFGDVHNARQTIEKALQGHRTKGSTYTGRLLLSLCLVEWLEGDLAGVQRTATQLLQLGQANDLLESAAFGHYFLGLTAYYRGDTETAQLHLSEAATTGRMVDPNTFLHANCALALSYQSRNKPEKANDIAQSLVTYASQTKSEVLLSKANALAADLAFRQGRLDEAIKWAQNFQPGQPQQELRFFVPQFTQIKILIARDESTARKNVRNLLNQLQTFFTSMNNTHCLIEVLTLKAMLRHAEGDQLKAIETLSRALDLAHQSHRILPFLDFGEPMAALMNQASHDGRYERYIDDIRSAYDQIRATEHLSAARASHKSQPLTNRELDIIHLLANRLTNKEIAAKLVISPGTVKRHTNNIYKKLNVNNRQDAVAEAKRIGIF